MESIGKSPIQGPISAQDGHFQPFSTSSTATRRSWNELPSPFGGERLGERLTPTPFRMIRQHVGMLFWLFGRPGASHSLVEW